MHAVCAVGVLLDMWGERALNEGAATGGRGKTFAEGRLKFAGLKRATVINTDERGAVGDNVELQDVEAGGDVFLQGNGLDCFFLGEQGAWSGGEFDAEDRFVLNAVGVDGDGSQLCGERREERE